MSYQLKCCVGVLLLCLLIPVAYSQEVRASLVGQVTDPSGAPIAGATVTATNLATNFTVTAKSNESGQYSTPYLAPGNYEMTAENTGFKKYVRKDLILQAGDKARVDIKLEVGELTQSVTVTEATSQLQTESASRSQVLASEIVASLPTQGRNPFQIAWAAAGVVKSGSWRYLRTMDIGGMSGISINGGREKTNEVLLDGISNVRAEYTIVNAPTTESVQEFKVQSNTYDAQYGRTGGGIITIVTKGGGNDLHGTAFEYFQNDRLNANQSELNTPQTVGGIYFPNGRKPPNHINQFGAQVSGPVVIPKLFNGKNRVFWMLSWESMRQRSADPDVKTFPIMDIRGGDFTNLFNAAGQQVLIYDPYTTQPDGTRTPFANNKIPTARLDPVAVNLLKFYPSPTTAGTGSAHINNYPYPSMWRASFDQFVGRTDVVINSKNTAFFRYSENPFQEYRAVVFGMDNKAEPTGNAPLLRNGRGMMMNWTSTLSPTMTFDLRFGLNRWEEQGGSSIGANFDPTTLGFSSSLVNQYLAKRFPKIIFDTGASSDYQSMGSDAIGPGTRDTYSLQPNFSKVIGRHFIKFGAEARQYNLNEPGRGYPSGSFTFAKGWTQRSVSQAESNAGNALATMLLGIPSGATVEKNIDRSYKHFYYAGFFQDDFKVTNKMTLNFGLRWDAESGPSERYNRMINGLNFNAASPIASKVSGLNLKGELQFAGVNGNPTTLFDTPKNQWQPRFGVAYKLHEKWVLRGGAGLYYIGDERLGSTNGFSRSTSAVTSLDGLTPTPGMTTAAPFTTFNNTLLNAIGTTNGVSSFLGEGPQSWVRDRKLPYTIQYSFDIQRELPGGMLAEIGYGGNTTRRLPIDVGLNYLPTSELNRRTIDKNGQSVIDNAYYTEKISNPMAGLIPNNASLNGATIQRQLLMYAFPQYSGPTLYSVPIGKNQFHGMTVKFTKRLSSGLSFLASYGIGKNLQQTRLENNNGQAFGGVGNLDATRLTKESNQNIDAPQKFVIAGIYELPFGKGRKFAATVPGVVDQIIGGWQINWDIVHQSGWVVDYPNAPQNAPGSAKISNPDYKHVFNTALFLTGTKTQESNTLRTWPYLFSDVRRPGYHNYDMSVSKYFPINEKVRLQFRGEGVNMLNHPWFADMASVDITNGGFGQLNPTQRNLPRFIKLALHLTF